MPKLYSSLLLLMAFSYSFSQSSRGGANGVARCSLNVSDSVVQTCFNEANGAIYVSVSGGTVPYHFLWNDGVTSADRSGLSAGFYTVTITDSNSCTFQLQATVPEYTQLNSTVISTPLCNSDSAVVIAVGENPPYRYNWSNGSSDSTLINVPVGDYGVTITDAHNCTATNIAVMFQDTVYPLIVILNDSFGFSKGVIYITDTVLYASPSSYLWSTSSTSDTIYNLGRGNYCVTLTDAAGCSAVACDSVTAATGINNIAVTNLFKLYPNPACNSITIENNLNGGASFSVFSLEGKLIDIRILKDSKTIVDVRLLAEGLYVCQIRNLSSGEVSYIKLEIQR